MHTSTPSTATDDGDCIDVAIRRTSEASKAPIAPTTTASLRFFSPVHTIRAAYGRSGHREPLVSELPSLSGVSMTEGKAADLTVAVLKPSFGHGPSPADSTSVSHRA